MWAIVASNLLTSRTRPPWGCLAGHRTASGIVRSGPRIRDSTGATWGRRRLSARPLRRPCERLGCPLKSPRLLLRACGHELGGARIRGLCQSLDRRAVQILEGLVALRAFGRDSDALRPARRQLHELCRPEG